VPTRSSTTPAISLDLLESRTLDGRTIELTYRPRLRAH
jgi:hypothetical protein